MKKVLLFFFLFIFFIFTFFNRYQPVSLDLKKPTTIQVEIKGEVKNPGVYTLRYQDTLQDLVDASGGFTAQADTAGISLLQVLSDQSVIVIAKQEQQSIQKVSINTASLEELDSLPGIGPGIAQRIIDYRSITSFTTLEQIKDVKGIGDALYEKIKDLIVL